MKNDLFYAGFFTEIWWKPILAQGSEKLFESGVLPWVGRVTWNTNIILHRLINIKQASTRWENLIYFLSIQKKLHFLDWFQVGCPKICDSGPILMLIKPICSELPGFAGGGGGVKYCRIFAKIVLEN